jgi:hypothetical protein
MNNQFQFGINHIICWVLVGLATISLVHIAPAHALPGSGWINGNYSFKDLELRRGIVNSTRHGRVHSCVFRGKIVSTSGSEQQNVTITFYAFNIFDEQMWESTIHIKSLPPFESHKFSKKISCQDREPYKWKFKVVESPENPNQ